MDPLSHHFFTMACNNAWANQRLLNACDRLSQAEFVAPATSFFPSIHATLNHNLTVDWYYVDALERSLAGLPVNVDARRYFEPEAPFGSSIELHAAQLLVDRRLVDVCQALTPTKLNTPIAVSRRSGVEVEHATRLLAHLFQHQIHHRGQVHAMLAGTSVTPPQLDELFCAGDAQLRAAELAELGLTESAIWSAAAG